MVVPQAEAATFRRLAEKSPYTLYMGHNTDQEAPPSDNEYSYAVFRSLVSAALLRVHENLGKENLLVLRKKLQEKTQAHATPISGREVSSDVLLAINYYMNDFAQLVELSESLRYFSKNNNMTREQLDSIQSSILQTIFRLMFKLALFRVRVPIESTGPADPRAWTIGRWRVMDEDLDLGDA